MNRLNLQDIEGWVQSPRMASKSTKGFSVFQSLYDRSVRKQGLELPCECDMLLSENIDTF